MITARTRLTDLNHVLRDVERLMRPRLGAGVDLEVRVESGQWPVSLAAPELERLLVDLVLDARDALPAGGLVSVVTGTVQLDGDHSHPALGPGAYVLIRVADDGAGIARGPALAEASRDSRAGGRAHRRDPDSRPRHEPARLPPGTRYERRCWWWRTSPRFAA